MVSSASSAARSGAASVRKHRRVLVPVLLTIAVILGFFACFAVWVNRQVLNTDNWVNTSGEVLANERVQDAVSAFAVNELFRSVNVAQELKSGLPTQLQGLAGPASAGLRTLAERAVPRLLATAAVQESWRRANRVAHAQLIQILNGGGKTISTKSGEVSLNLHELVTQLAAQLGLSSQLEAARSKLQGAGGAQAREVAKEKLGVTLPSTTGTLVIMRSSQLKAAQDLVKAIRHLAIVLPLLSIALFALAIFLDKGRRRKALRTTGWCFFGIGVLLLLGRRAGGDAIVNSLVKVPANKPAVHDVWSIGTQLLYDIAIAMVLYGLALVAAAWLAGSTRPATGSRRALAPWLREHAVGSYLVAEAILLLIVLWGPTPATRQWLPVIGFAVLFAFGVSVLRAQTGREFPDAELGEATARLRAWWADTRARRSHAPAVAGTSDAGNGSAVDALERLANLHERGALTDAEFAAEKRRLLAAAH
jgi:Short C-terminal domain